MMLKLTYVSLFALVACTAPASNPTNGDDDDDNEPVCTDRGFTDGCSGSTCQPGQYCNAEGAGFDECTNGCLSDTNCACNQTCQKSPGEQVGVCGSGGPGPGPDDPAVEDCMNACSFIDSQQCFDTGDLDACWNRCKGASDGNIQTFIGCVVNEIECSGFELCIDGL